MDTQIREAIKRGVAYLSQNQLPDGSFVSLSSPDPTRFDTATARSTTFCTSSVLIALHGVDESDLAQVNARAAAFLLSEKSSHWSYNYWTKQSPLYNSQPYPDDLDDTFLALSALTLHDPTLIDGTAMGFVTQMLIQNETKPGGPYRTWLIDSAEEKDWLDVDIAVNANIGYFLSLHDVQLPHIKSLLDDAIESNQISSPYYPNLLPIAYFISRWYQGEHTQLLSEQVVRELGNHDVPCWAALALSSLVRLGGSTSHVSSIAEDILGAQQSDGSWAPGAFCIDPAQDGVAHYAGSGALTTALCLEALTIYSALSSDDTKQQQPAVISEGEMWYRSVRAQVDSEIATISGEELRMSVQKMIDDQCDSDKDHHIVLLPMVVTQALNLQTELETLSRLSQISLWGWAAYNVLDDFLDEEGEPNLLPGAMFCLRRVDNLIKQTLPDNQAFQHTAQALLERIETANAWEVAHTRVEVVNDTIQSIVRLPDYGNYWQLADRSIGHAIPALGVIYASPDWNTQNKARALLTFFEHYLIARQLNDDAHDWEEDLRRGSLNAVAVQLFQKWEAKGHDLAAPVVLDTVIPELRLVLWRDTIDDIGSLVLGHIKQARTALSRLGLAADTSELDALLSAQEAVIQKVKKERQNTLAFINSLKK